MRPGLRLIAGIGALGLISGTPAKAQAPDETSGMQRLPTMQLGTITQTGFTNGKLSVAVFSDGTVNLGVRSQTGINSCIHAPEGDSIGISTDHTVPRGTFARMGNSIVRDVQSGANVLSAQSTDAIKDALRRYPGCNDTGPK